MLHSDSPFPELEATRRKVEGTGQVCLWEAWTCSLRLGLPVNHSGQNWACEMQQILFLDRVGSVLFFSLDVNEGHVTDVNLLNSWFSHALVLISFLWIKLIPLGQGKWNFSIICWMEEFCLIFILKCSLNRSTTQTTSVQLILLPEKRMPKKYSNVTEDYDYSYRIFAEG